LTLTKQNTEALIILCKAKNQYAQLELYNRYYHAMYNTAFRIVKDSYHAEDIMQDAFLLAFTKLGTLNDHNMFGPWLKRIVINSCLDSIKAKRMELYPLNEEIYKLVDIENDSGWGVPEDTDISEVLAAIEELPINYKTTVKLFLLEGYDHQEISEILQISENASRTYLHRGKTRLKEKLKNMRYGTGY